MEIKRKTSFTLTPTALRLLRLLADHLGIPQSAILEILIRERATTDLPAEGSRQNG